MKPEEPAFDVIGWLCFTVTLITPLALLYSVHLASSWLEKLWRDSAVSSDGKSSPSATEQACSVAIDTLEPEET
jgi:hypothetical protein